MRVTLILLIAFVAFAFSQKVMLYNYRETCDERTLEDNIEVYDNDHCVQSLSRHNYFKYVCNRTHVTFGQYQDSSCQTPLRELAFPINSCQVNSRYVCGVCFISASFPILGSSESVFHYIDLHLLFCFFIFVILYRLLLQLVSLVMLKGSTPPKQHVIDQLSQFSPLFIMEDVSALQLASPHVDTLITCKGMSYMNNTLNPTAVVNLQSKDSPLTSARNIFLPLTSNMKRLVIEKNKYQYYFPLSEKKKKHINRKGTHTHTHTLHNKEV